MKTEHPLVVEVRQEHIERGQRKRACHCPIALALREQWGGSWSVGTDSCSQWSPMEDDFKLPPEAMRFVTNFDRGNPVKPFTFTIST